ncbi:MAG: hypothetical protein JWR69_501 [Pedosphaera sp.]|nr:hypothetical protein [Pedosphaera sp.]
MHDVHTLPQAVLNQQALISPSQEAPLPMTAGRDRSRIARLKQASTALQVTGLIPTGMKANRNHLVQMTDT